MQVVYFSQILLFGFLCISLIMRIIQMVSDFSEPSEKA